MKHILTYLVLILFSYSSIDAQEVFRVGKVEMTFDTTFIDLGKVRQGDTRQFEFKFTNTGEEDIEISIVSGCSCTTTDWPRGIIKPGDEATIPVTFDSSEKEESEVVDVDITLKNTDPKKGYEIFKIVNFAFELIKE